MVSKVEDKKFSRAGVEMLDFRLHDAAGNFVQCRAHDRHARNPCIVDRNEIVVYGAIANSPQNNQTGLLWLFNESHVVVLKRSCPMPKALRFIDFEEDE